MSTAQTPLTYFPKNSRFSTRKPAKKNEAKISLTFEYILMNLSLAARNFRRYGTSNNYPKKSAAKHFWFS